VFAEGHLDHEPHETLDAVRRRQHVAIVDQGTATVEPVEVAQTRHPWILADARRSAAHDPRLVIALSASEKI